MIITPLEAALVYLLKQSWKAVPLAVVKEHLPSVTFANLHLSAQHLLQSYAPPPRLDFDHYFMKMALVVGERHSCPKREVGAVITHNNRFISSGYNGKASKTADCLFIPCQGASHPAGSNTNLCQATHAELNALSRVCVGGADTMYVTVMPCRDCCTAMLPYELKRVVYLSPTTETLGIELLAEAGVEVVPFKPIYYIS